MKVLGLPLIPGQENHHHVCTCKKHDSCREGMSKVCQYEEQTPDDVVCRGTEKYLLIFSRLVLVTFEAWRTA